MNKELKIFLSYCQKNDHQADTIEHDLKTKHNLTVIRDIRDVKAFGSVKKFMKSVRDSDFVIKLISKEYLESDSCMYEVIEFIKDNNQLLHYLERTIPIIIPNARQGKHNIFKPSGKLFWTKYWANKHKELFHEYQEFIKGNYSIDLDIALKELRNDLGVYKTISECISNEFLTYICNHKLCVNYNGLLKNDYRQILFKISPNQVPNLNRESIPNKSQRISNLDTRFKLISIVENADPKHPEFPPENPQFPATPTIPITINGFDNVWLKDESYNPTGTHKDRLAYEVIRKFYKPLLKSNIANDKKSIPHLSMISSGSAAFAIQRLLNNYNLPHLKVLTDENTNKTIINSLKNIGCEIFYADLNEKALTCSEILDLTDNHGGVDISSRDMLDPINYVYYDWLSYEILNNKGDYYFIPFGTGDLFSNILNISVKEALSSTHDKRLIDTRYDYSKSNFIGVTTSDKKSIMDKLYSPFLPFSGIRLKEIEEYKEIGVCGELTGIRYLEENLIYPALEIAERNNINCEPSGIAGLAMLLSMESQIPKDKKIVVVNTGKLKLDLYEL
ncbi:pyridoxal-phosphate dependent enzyme [Flavivirga aquimarina]|uniref:Pyridoxal-phosphate dependent enzyme n=1 Tax=Flavivirga aquimarina TaxID=2027862 RepID=A0ABT8WGH0_9FLAO|nr:pyridoxal-phosphate dependent enzyme [Flavivirga aquimarina]MDO5972114.1 pyridoxal-phosphate dependent enzyme [Flavivirga aquimarina]